MSAQTTLLLNHTDFTWHTSRLHPQTSCCVGISKIVFSSQAQRPAANLLIVGRTRTVVFHLIVNPNTFGAAVRAIYLPDDNWTSLGQGLLYGLPSTPQGVPLELADIGHVASIYLRVP